MKTLIAFLLFTSSTIHAEGAIVARHVDDIPPSERILKVDLLVNQLPDDIVMDCDTVHQHQADMEKLTTVLGQHIIIKKSRQSLYNVLSIVATQLVLLAREGTCASSSDEVSGGILIEYRDAGRVVSDTMNFSENGTVVSWHRRYGDGTFQTHNFHADGRLTDY